MIRAEIIDELTFSFVKSSGAGGQHVNKANTKVELYFDVQNSQYLNDSEKEKILKKLNNRINSVGLLIITCQTERSQYRNRKKAIELFITLVEDALKEEKKRIKTMVPRALKEKRIKDKKQQSDKKTLRRPPEYED